MPSTKNTLKIAVEGDEKIPLGKSINTQHYAQSTQFPKFPDIWFNWEGFHTIPLYIHVVNFGM